MDIRNLNINIFARKNGFDPVQDLDSLLSIIQGHITEGEKTMIKAKNYTIHCNGNDSCQKGIGFLSSILKKREIKYKFHGQDELELTNVYPNAYYDHIGIKIKDKI